MQLRMGSSQRLESRQELLERLALAQEHRQALAYALRLELVHALTGERFEPKADCPECGRHLELVEILKGFSEDPTDFTTACPKCSHRFIAHLATGTQSGSMTLVFYCPTQTTAKLGEKTYLSPRELEHHDPSLYRSTLIHFGSITNALATIGIVYKHVEVPSWRPKIEPFLGKMPDTMIAECVGVPVGRISRLRAKKRIPVYRAGAKR